MSNIKLKVTRPMWLHGKCHAAGDIVSVPATNAAAMMESGRCELLDPADKAVVTAASRQQVQDLMRLQRSMSAPAGSPWQTVDY